MITKMKIWNFKRFDEVVIDLGENVVFIGPNDSGKTTALQALALWDIGYRQWRAKRLGKSSAKQRIGVAINRRDLISLPVATADLLWRGRRVRSGTSRDGKQQTLNIRIGVLVEGIGTRGDWQCGFEFDYANVESIYCRPLGAIGGGEGQRVDVPEIPEPPNIAFLPPMSGLADREYLKQTGEIGVLIGMGQTAQVLRNVCYKVCVENQEKWAEVKEHVKRLFGVTLLDPAFDNTTAEITMSYRDGASKKLDLTCSGRGLLQTLLLTAYLYAHPQAVLLLDEPDAHLEVLRQRQIYDLVTNIARSQKSQIIAASHSEIVLSEAASRRDRVIAFVGKPHSLTDKGSQVLKSLQDIGFDQYFQAEQKGWVLYVEDASDLAILKAFSQLLGHPLYQHLDSVFVKYVQTDLPQRARDHFFGLREAKPDLKGFALFDRLDKQLQSHSGLVERMWSANEIENYLCSPHVLLRYASAASNLFSERQKQAMEEAIREVTQALETIGQPSPWSRDIKASEQVLEPVFRNYSKKLGIPLALRKSQFHELVQYMQPQEIDPEVVEVLNAILATAEEARPA